MVDVVGLGSKGKSYSEFDPIEDTESYSDSCRGSTRDTGYSEFDPIEDTERLRAQTHLC